MRGDPHQRARHRSTSSTRARRYDVTHLVCISTDKAAAPTSVMGASKWVAEQIVLDARRRDDGYCSVRFGNVLGSRGSVIPTFQRQIAAGGPVTVTDPRMTRYFMSTDEAVRLVLLRPRRTDGDHHVLALEMGEQVNIYELAERMIRLCGLRPHVDIEIEITGLRPGEKLSEAVIGPAEQRAGPGPADPHDRARAPRRRPCSPTRSPASRRSRSPTTTSAHGAALLEVAAPRTRPTGSTASRRRAASTALTERA